MSKPRWDLKELKTFCCMPLQRSSSRLPLTLISSLSRLTEIFRYHLRLARDAADGVFDSESPGGLNDLLLVFGQSERQDEFEQAKIVSEANLIGCLHAARGLLEIFAQLVNELALSPKVNVGQVDVQQITQRLPASRLKTELCKTLNSASYQYVCAFTNTTKHRQLVPHVVSVSLVGGDTGLRLDLFSYGKETYPARSIREALEAALCVANALTSLGPLLNDHVIRDVR